VTTWIISEATAEAMKGQTALKTYLQRVYDARFYWIHLARIELKNKFRRSKLGLLWTFVSPLCLTAIMSIVFSVAFNMDIVTYAPYILSGILVWELVSASFNAGGMAIVGNESYIRQFSHPITIYTLKSAIVYTISFLISMTALVLWMLVTEPKNLLVGLITLPLTALLLFCLSWGATTIAAYTFTRYRDYPQMVALILQTIWYLSPVFLQESMFLSNPVLSKWFSINPVTHMLALVRKPFLQGSFAEWIDYAYMFGIIIVAGCVAFRMNRNNEKDIIFYI